MNTNETNVQPVSKPAKPRRYTFWLAPALLDAMRERAAIDRRSVSWEISEAIRLYANLPTTPKP